MPRVDCFVLHLQLILGDPVDKTHAGVFSVVAALRYGVELFPKLSASHLENVEDYDYNGITNNQNLLSQHLVLCSILQSRTKTHDFWTFT